MSKDAYRSVAVRVGVVVSTLLLMGGCAQPATEISGEYSDLTLLETKLSAQLNRNEAASRIPQDAVAEVESTVDTSAACLSEREDPEGKVRSWHSSVTVRLNDADANRVDLVIDILASTFADQGWSLDSAGGSSIVHTRTLSNDKSSTIKISATSTDEDALDVASSELQNASVVIEVDGPCVMTDGAESDEVKHSEKERG